MPLYKSDEKSLIDNYRPISVLNVLSKLIECIEHQQLSEYLEKNNLFYAFQFGFRRGRSTQQAVTQLTDSSISIWIRAALLVPYIWTDLRRLIPCIMAAF